MLKFNSFLKEEILLSEITEEILLSEMAAASSSMTSDDKGKLHELLLAKHLNPSEEKKLPSHHRAEADIYGDASEGGTPEQVHDKIKARISEDAYDEVDSHSKQTAAETLDHLEKNGFPRTHLHEIYWTSNRDTVKKPGDHQKTTGVHDPNANADIILTYKHPETGEKRFVGVSAKYGTEQHPNYRNDGLVSLEQKAGLEKGAITSIQKDLDNNIETIGYSGTKEVRHKEYKIGRSAKAEELKAWKAAGGSSSDYKPQSIESRRATTAEVASVNARSKMARLIDSGLSRMDDSQLRNFIRGQVSPPTRIYHVVAHSHVQDDGSAISHVGDMDKIADRHLDNFQNLRVKQGRGIATTVVGDYNGKERAVATQIVKTGSGPVKGSAGSFKLVSIPKKMVSATKPPVKKTSEEAGSGEHAGASFYGPGEK